ncbi:is4 family protein [Leptolyngbya sp. Heron Island J]|uniref:DDE transposase family protein n=1 Tax=Leptolyngbya sp. Heron Island J TaxID=1385935 RepID=UPI0003B9D06D|nr:DDE transposase family protein [Leptolyngbya sp. Heron Island J]ESA38714.1 is4 family protein [Leptolyngbya sp. Heron Island J]
MVGLLSDVDRSQSNRWLHKLQPILETALGKEMVLPERRIKSMAEFIERFPEAESVIIDGVERSIQRP